jgi:HK97 family phage prohead protease
MEDSFTFIIGGIDEFSHTEVEIKGTKKYYVTGYISTKDLDLVNDIVTEEALIDMAEQVNKGNIKLDMDHEAWKKGDDGPNMLPIGRIIEAKFEPEQNRLWVKAQINSNSTRFAKAWANIKDKFIDAFSIAFKPIQIATKYVNGKEIRLLEKVLLLNVALTGNPANPEAKITNVFAKSRDYMEEQNMADEKIVEIKEEVVEEPVAEEVVEEPVAEEVPVVEEKTLLEIATEKFNAQIKALEESAIARDSEIKDLKDKLEAPQFKSEAEVPVEEPVEEEEEVETKTPFQLIQ